MDEFNDIIDSVFHELEKTNDVWLFDGSQKSKLAFFNKYKRVIKLETEIVGLDGSVEVVTLFICFNSDFPASIPSIYLEEKDYEKIKFIPHLDTNRLICTFDNATTITNPKDPIGITKTALKKAKKILEDGLQKLNKSDFDEEFLSYWENTYNKEENVKRNILSFIQNSPNEKEVTLLLLDKKLKGFKYVLIQDNLESNNFKSFLIDRNVKYSEHEIFYSSRACIGSNPPFNLSVRNANKLINEFEKDNFNVFLNKREHPKLILYAKEVNSTVHYIGWFYPVAQLNRNGFRAGTLSPLRAYTSFQLNDKLIRVSPQSYNENRMVFRSKGMENNSLPLNFCIAGLGSIGSHLIHFLESFKLSNYSLIDPDILSLENTARHLLGFNYVHNYKAEALKDFLELKDPRRKLASFPKSILEILQDEPKIINNSDYLFLVTGRQDIEEVLCENIKSGKILTPTFIIWVEPYLFGGHCIFLHPEDYRHEEFYEKVEGVTLFRNNVIDSSEYISDNDILSKKEASCQSSFMPYSENSVLSFLSLLSIQIQLIIKNKSKKSMSFTWIGETNKMDGMGLKKSNRHTESVEYSLIS